MNPGQAIRDALEPLGFAVLGDQLAQVLERHFSADSKPLPGELSTIKMMLEITTPHADAARDDLIHTAALAIKGLLLMVKQGV